MRMNRIVYITLILVGFNAITFSQQNNVLSLYSHQFEVEETRPDFHIHTDHSNELKTISSLLFLFYKEFISSQDMEACVFTPSCSVYAIESIKKKGFLFGFIAALDRITRCSGLAYGYYPVDEETNLNIDPVE